jgi:glycine cleavage system H protein
MSLVPAELRYTRSHEWVRREPDGNLTMGLTDHAQEQMGEIVMVELPAEGRRVRPGDSLGVLEAVKTAEDYFAPVEGEIAAVNQGLESDPGLVNRECYGAGWLVVIRPSDPSSYDALLSAEQYRELAGD